MSERRFEFAERLRRVAQKHEAMSHGYQMRLREDGLVVAEPKRPRVPISPRSILVFVAVLLMFKGLLIASLGEVTYEDRLSRLTNGTMAEQLGGWVLQTDPASVWIADQIGFLFPRF